MNYPSPDPQQPPYQPQVPVPPVAPPQSGPPYSDPYSAPPQYGAPQYGAPQYDAAPQYGTGPQYTPGQPFSAPPQQTPPTGYGLPYAQTPPPKAGVNGFAIASLIFGIMGGILLSVVFGFVALSQIKKRNQSGKGMAVAGLVLSGIWALAICVGIGIAIVADGTSGTSGSTDAGRDTSVHSLRVGSCVNLGDEDDEEIESMPVVPCSGPHDAEVVGEFKLTGSTYPGDEAIGEEADERCGQMIKSYAPSAASDKGVETYYLYPTTSSWISDNDRVVTCMASFATPRSGSLKG